MASRWSVGAVGSGGHVESHGHRLLHELQRDLPLLSPKLRSVAQFCLQHAATLHHYRIQEVAETCGTIPASVVRLAQRFGLKGFQEMKLAFLDRMEPVVDFTPAPQDHRLPPECLAASHDIDDSALGLMSLKGLALRPEFLHVVQSLQSATRIHFDWTGEEDRLIALHLQARMRSVGCRQVDTGTKNQDIVSGGAWLVQVAVWHDVTPCPSWFVAADFGSRILRLARGDMNRSARNTHAGIVIRVGTDARRMLNAFALCEALATAVKPGHLSNPLPRNTHASMDLDR
ncbi:MurR/RpiR family transcriptional regulator [Sphaerotilus sp.]|uniref:MurR/RpiR family transcriptional regulator n=1 Tax=Sphaerotilus sp. TaxID=2093942 RepID=UPI0034E1A180